MARGKGAIGIYPLDCARLRHIRRLPFMLPQLAGTVYFLIEEYPDPLLAEIRLSHFRGIHKEDI